MGKTKQTKKVKKISQKQYDIKHKNKCYLDTGISIYVKADYFDDDTVNCYSSYLSKTGGPDRLLEGSLLYCDEDKMAMIYFKHGTIVDDNNKAEGSHVLAVDPESIIIPDGTTVYFHKITAVANNKDNKPGDIEGIVKQPHNKKMKIQIKIKDLLLVPSNLGKKVLTKQATTTTNKNKNIETTNESITGSSRNDGNFLLGSDSDSSDVEQNKQSNNNNSYNNQSKDNNNNNNNNSNSNNKKYDVILYNIDEKFTFTFKNKMRIKT